MFKKILAVAGVASAIITPQPTTVHVVGNQLQFDFKTADEAKVFDKIYEGLLKDFDVKSYSAFLNDFKVGLKNYEQSDAFKTIPAAGHCDKGATPSAQLLAPMKVQAASAFPGGILKRVFGFDMSKLVYELSQKAAGPASSQGGLVAMLAMQALTQGAGMVQNLVANAVHIIPPMISPPVWNNKPLTCMPMVTGHNCFGAILHPITMADFVIADVTDRAVSSYIDSFPKLYASKVGKTSDAQYKACFQSYMSMHCASVFPRCNEPQAREEPSPVGRLPMCFTHCLQTLVMCPGFWVDDIMGVCQDVSVPPMCSVAAYWNLWRAPPQYTTFEEANAPAAECPAPLTSAGGLDAGMDANLFQGAGASSAAEGAAIARLPSA